MKTLSLVVAVLVASVADAREIKVASGSQCIGAVKAVEASFESKSGHSITHIHDDGMTFMAAMFVLDNQRADLAFITFSSEDAIKEIETQKLKLKNVNRYTWHPVGKTRQIFFTYPKGPKKMTADHIQKIMTAEVENWKELGGEDLPIRIAYQANTNLTQNLISKKFTMGEPLKKKGWTAFPKYEDVVKFVKENEGAMAFGPENDEVKGVSIPDQPLLVRTITAVTIDEPDSDLKKFIETVAKGQ